MKSGDSCPTCGHAVFVLRIQTPERQGKPTVFCSPCEKEYGDPDVGTRGSLEWLRETEATSD